MTHDQQTVLKAYDDAVQKLYATFLDQTIPAGATQAGETEAEQHFGKGLQTARFVRDRALQLTATPG